MTLLYHSLQGPGNIRQEKAEENRQAKGGLLNRTSSGRDKASALMNSLNMWAHAQDWASTFYHGTGSVYEASPVPRALRTVNGGLRKGHHFPQCCGRCSTAQAPVNSLLTTLV